MLRQLARLTRPVPAAGPGALALAVYTDPSGELVVAKESGFEGVACVDDAARVLDVLCDVWERPHDPEVERWARGLLEFVLWMQGDDGRWWNFVYDWSGTRNETGLTSSTGENFWHARALLGVEPRVARRSATSGRTRRLRRGLEHAIARRGAVRRASAAPGGRPPTRSSTVRSAASTIAVRRWADEIASCRIGDVLMNNPDERGEPHLWAHVQEGVLAEAGSMLDDADADRDGVRERPRAAGADR